MRLPIIPIIVAALLLSGAIYLFNSIEPTRTFGVPGLAKVADIEGIETEVAIAPDGSRYVVVASGDLWLVEAAGGPARRIVRTAEKESFPAWNPDGKRITFSRGQHTFFLSTDHIDSEPQVFKENATWLSFSATGRMAFVRNRALWLADPLGGNEAEILAAEQDTEMTIRNPRFSPDSIHVAFIKSLLNLRGQVWTIDVLTSATQPLVADRDFENPQDVGWITDGKRVVYLTNRAGSSYALWQVDLVEYVNLPLTQPLLGLLLEPVGIGVWNDRIVLPRYSLDSNIELSDGTPVIATDSVELEPAMSPDGQLVAYTVAGSNSFEIWTAGIHGENPTFQTMGREPRFSANGFELLYTQTSLDGNQDIWKHDIRNGNSERVTDADEIDFAPDTSPDGRSAAFASERAGPVSIWTINMAGGKRLRINEGGYSPAYSPDGTSIAFWRSGSLWAMGRDGGNSRQMMEGAKEPATPVWTSKGLAALVGQEVRTATQVLFTSTRPLWPQFDVLPDGRFLIAPIDMKETALWAVDLTYTQN